MKQILCIPFLLIGITSFAQKETTKKEQTLVNIFHFAPQNHLGVNLFTFNVQESYLDVNGVPQMYTINSPYIGPLVSVNKYLESMRAFTGVSYSDRRDFLQLQNEQIPFINIEIEATDLQFISERDKRPIIRLNNSYNTKLQYYIQATVKLTHVQGATLTPMGEKIISINQVFEKQFPKDYLTVANTRIRATTEDSLDILWNQHRHFAKEQWRIEKVRGLILDLAKQYQENCVSERITHFIHYYTDKNKKGGFDEIVTAGEKFDNLLKTVHKRGSVTNTNDLNHFWSADIQRELVTCKDIWKRVLETKTISEQLRSKLTYNYAIASLLSGEFDEVSQLLNENLAPPFRSMYTSDYNDIVNLRNRLQREFEAHAINQGWVRARDL